uniref:CCHC-type domain-containing protein n=1 Tax=Tanacetum cinerariifolium TaxID=118510 RepID=A0A6L2JRX6_TANCI|nr:hypothetical protein [Tanacetum cinerariifolium]
MHLVTLCSDSIRACSSNEISGEGTISEWEVRISPNELALQGYVNSGEPPTPFSTFLQQCEAPTLNPQVSIPSVTIYIFREKYFGPFAILVPQLAKDFPCQSLLPSDRCVSAANVDILMLLADRRISAANVDILMLIRFEQIIFRIMLHGGYFDYWKAGLVVVGKENGVNIFKSIDEGPFQRGTLRETLTEGTEGALHLGPERPRVYSDLTSKENDRYNADIRATNILLQGLPKYIYSLINHYTDANDIWENVKTLLEGLELTKKDRLSSTDNLIENLTNTLAILTQSYKTYLPQTSNQLRTSSNPRNQATIQDGRVVVQNVQGQQNKGQRNNTQGAGAAGYGGAQNRVGGQDNTVDENVDKQHVQDLALNVDNLFQADECDAFDSDVDEAPTAQTMFKANLSSADPVSDEACPSYDSNILSEYNADIRAINILLQGLPKDIYTLINHYTDAKDIWNNVKMLLDGSELTKEDRESQLYDDFEHFRQQKGESIHNCYVRFAKLINDMRNIKMTMSRLQLNSKFVNNMLPEWVDPLALMSNASNPQHYSPSSSTSSSTQVPQPIVDSSLSPAESLIENLTNTLALLTQSYETFLPQTNNQLRTSSNARNQATIQDDKVVVQNVQGRQNRGQGINPRGESAARYGRVQNRVENVNPGHARPGLARPVKCYNCNGTGHIARNCTQLKRPQNSEYFKDKMLLMQAQENRVALDEKQLLSLASGQDNAFDNDVDEQPAQDLALNVDNVFQADDYDAFDSDVDEAPTAQTMFIAILSSADRVNDEAGPSYDSDILSENENKILMHNTEDTLEIAEITRKKINDKMNDPECMTRKVKIAPHDYSKENFLATLTPQKQLTLEQVFWSNDLMKLC